MNRERRSAITNAALATLACVLMLSCGDYGGDVHAGSRSYAPPDMAWRVWYPAPPWERRGADATGVVLHVPSLFPSMNSTILGDNVVLKIVSTTGSAAAALAGAIAGAAVTGDGAVVTQRPVALAHGASGIEVALLGPSHSLRIVAAETGPGRAVTLVFESTLDLRDDADVADLLAHFELRPSGP